jgi:hypothetical protein
MRSNRRSRILASAALLVLATGLAACAATRERRGVPEPSGFLGSTYSLLAPNADFPVTLWVDKADSKLSPEDQQMLTDTFFKAIHEAVSASFAVVDHPGAGTIRLRAALTQAKGSPVALRAITTIVPQLRVATTLVGLSADTAVTVGSATAEIELRDSITGNLLAAAVDSRAGNKALFSSRTFTKWGDVEAAQKLWAERIAWQLARHGVQRKPGAPMPKEPSA